MFAGVPEEKDLDSPWSGLSEPNGGPPAVTRQGCSQDRTDAKQNTAEQGDSRPTPAWSAHHVTWTHVDHLLSLEGIYVEPNQRGPRRWFLNRLGALQVKTISYWPGVVNKCHIV